MPEHQTERQIFLSCAPWVPDADRPCYAIAQQAGTPTSRPVMIQKRLKREQRDALSSASMRPGAAGRPDPSKPVAPSG